jgi:hypothetical protein
LRPIAADAVAEESYLTSLASPNTVKREPFGNPYDAAHVDLAAVFLEAPEGVVLVLVRLDDPLEADSRGARPGPVQRELPLVLLDVREVERGHEALEIGRVARAGPELACRKCESRSSFVYLSRASRSCSDVFFHSAKKRWSLVLS